MNIWELLSIACIATVVSLFSGPRAALTKSIHHCSFEVFVEAVDSMNGTLAPALTVLLPTAFLSLFLEILESYQAFPKLIFLDVGALLLLSAALLLAVVFELPIVEEIAKWPARLTIPDDWQAVRQRWLVVHLVRVALGWLSLLLLIATGCIQVFMALNR